MNGAQVLLRTLVGAGVEVCFANPGTSEMHFVAALDAVPEMRPVLGLFEGVATGAADGYGRMAGKPAATLLHLGPGLSNGLANIHNARKGRVPMLNVVGDHATFHKRYDAPLSSDIDGLARPLSHFLRTCSSPATIGSDAADAVAAAMAPPGQIATLIVPADVSWSEAGEPAAPRLVPARTKVDANQVDAVVRALRSGRCAMLMNGEALGEQGLSLGSRIANTVGARLLCDTFTARLERGAGRSPIERLPYFGEQAADELKDLQHLVLVGAAPPVAFFAYPGKPSYLVPDGCAVHVLARPEDDAIDALQRLADALGALPGTATRIALDRPALPSGPISAKTLGQVIGALLPEGAIVADEGNTEGFLVQHFCAGAPPHTWLSNTGGSIGLGLPLATGAAIACPGRKVLCIEGDGSAMYTLQALWTQARENLDVVNLILSNRSYRILNFEFLRVGAGQPGERARGVLELNRPDLDFVALAKGMGMPGVRIDTAEALAREVDRALSVPGPCLIEVVIAS